MDPEKLDDAIDLSHHLSTLSRARATSPLKGLQKYWGKPGLISLAGGLPSPALFPFSSLSGEALVADSFPSSSSEGSSSFSWLWNLFSGPKDKERTTTLQIDKYPKNPGDLSLAQLLQYGMATGAPQLHEFLMEFTRRVYQPGYKNFTTLVHAGNTDGWSKAAMTLCNPGEGIITSEWTYPSALASVLPYNVKPVPVAMDGQGMRSDALRTLLSEWDETARGMARPHVMYTVPIGQNPTGSTMEAARKKEIYAICVEYDVIIVEDDPYFFLQQGPYVPKGQRTQDATTQSDEEFIASLAPSYLKFDYQGRVIRLETFSKTIAPGSRLGWFTCNPRFAERLERQGETSTQAPCGFGQGFVTSLLLTWKFDGYVRWLKALRIQYKDRRDYFIDCLAEEFALQRRLATGGHKEGSFVYDAYLKPKASLLGGFNEKSSTHNEALFSFVPPSAGMFVWLELHLEQHPSFRRLGSKVLEEKLWEALAEGGVLFGPGYMFSALPITDDYQGSPHFRISFSNNEFDEMKKAVKIFESVLRKFMKHL